MILTPEIVQAAYMMADADQSDLNYAKVVGIRWDPVNTITYTLTYEDGTTKHVTEDMLMHMSATDLGRFYQFLEYRLGEIPIPMPTNEEPVPWVDEYGMNRDDHHKPSRSEELQDAIRVALSSHGPRIIYVPDINWHRMALDILDEYTDDQGWSPSEDANYLPLDKTKVIIAVDPAVEAEYRKLKVVIPVG